MMKKLESELMSIAHKILKLKGKEDVNKMHSEVAALYEKLTVLKFAQENFENDLPTIGNNSSFFGMLDTAFNNTVSDNIEVGNKTYIDVDERDDDEIMEPVMEKIKDMVAQMPEETQQVDAVFDAIQSKYHKNDFEDITADFKETPIFDKLSDVKSAEKKSLNDKLKSGGLTIGLNDKLAFIKHLFDGKNEDYDRVVSQLNTMSNFDEANTFIKTTVKPDYNSWVDKDEYAERFMELIESRFN
ncbi:hypothetical protein [Lacinutrix jangbogonensis]|uniref:hypothetical protein n=1 Tax=Lacinutrix jangbogonensis TaxID=1469557 RepID=UPI00053DAAA2|nr:hypothetical protein [Lacinutrix jangbogonensis]